MKWVQFTLCLCFALLLAACAAEEPILEEAATPSQLASTAIPADETQSVPEDSGEETIFAALREDMVQEGVIAWGVEDPDVIEAMRAVPRHEFVPEEYLSQAYDNHPLPIGHGQTISQPYIVALMTQAADVESGDNVLEIGTGSGYQAAVLAELVDTVYSIEIIGPLVERAKTTLDRVGYDNVTIHHADGYFGLEEESPFDAIVVTAAPDHIPQPLVQQLKIGGRMIIPVGPVGGFQTLWLITKLGEDEVRTEDLGGVRFVPLTREVR
jgi:protein-L-isoaspartate(D-aspartate) O-methyltransferase